MRALIISDLHQGEGGVDYDPAGIRAPFDLVIVAGDATGRLTHSLKWLHDHFGGSPVVYVAGNHDFYRSGERDGGFTIEGEMEDGRELAARRGIHFLENDRIDLGEIRILGATLWTDLRSKLHHSQSAADGEVKRRMNDYRRIHRYSSTRGSRPISPEFTRAMHYASRTWFDAEMAKPFAGNTVVVTHHAPTLQSLPDQTDVLNHAYASDLTSVITLGKPVLWVHGHIHCQSDYRLGETRILCNPLGREGERSGFVGDLIIDVQNGV
jgi:3',5'-cyclic AMP phosphodiesterase CpdA